MPNGTDLTNSTDTTGRVIPNSTGSGSRYFGKPGRDPNRESFRCFPAQRFLQTRLLTSSLPSLPFPAKLPASRCLAAAAAAAAAATPTSPPAKRAALLRLPSSLSLLCSRAPDSAGSEADSSLRPCLFCFLISIISIRRLFFAFDGCVRACW